MNAMKKFFSNKSGDIVIVQPPNIPLMAGLGLLAASFFVRTGGAHTVMAALASGALSYWALSELTSGESPFRRVLGAVVGGYCFWSFLRLLSP